MATTQDSPKASARPALEALLADGQWHTLGEIYQVVAPLIPPESAARVYLNDQLSGRRPPVDFAVRLAAGRKAIVREMLTGRDCETRGPRRGWDREYRTDKYQRGS